MPRCGAWSPDASAPSGSCRWRPTRTRGCGRGSCPGPCRGRATTPPGWCEEAAMTNISRDSHIVELNGPPRFEYGQKVQSRTTVRNDGTFPGREIGDIPAHKVH